LAKGVAMKTCYGKDSNCFTLSTVGLHKFILSVSDDQNYYCLYTDYMQFDDRPLA